MSLRSRPQPLESDLSNRFGLGLRLSKTNPRGPLALPDLRKLAAVEVGVVPEVSRQNIIEMLTSMDIKELSRQGQNTHNMLRQAGEETSEKSRYRNFVREYRPLELNCMDIQYAAMRYFQKSSPLSDAVEEIANKCKDDNLRNEYIACISEVYVNKFPDNIPVGEFKTIATFVSQKLLDAIRQVLQVIYDDAKDSNRFDEAVEAYKSNLNELLNVNASSTSSRQQIFDRYKKAQQDIMEYAYKSANAVRSQVYPFYMSYNAQYRVLVQRMQAMATGSAKPDARQEVKWTRAQFEALPLRQAVEWVVANYPDNQNVLYGEFLPKMEFLDYELELLNHMLTLSERYKSIREKIKNYTAT